MSTPLETGIDPVLFREVLGYYPTGVAVISAIAPDGTPEAMTVGTFTSISLDPPLVGYFPAKTSATFERIRDSGSFCVNVLGSHQEVLCRAFASQVEDRFHGVSWTPAPSGSPIIDGVVAWIDADVVEVREIGDHYFVIGSVRALQAPRRELPLLFFERGYGRFAPLQYVTRSTKDFIPVFRAVESARPFLEEVAAEIGERIVVTVGVEDQMVHAAVAGDNSFHPSSIVGRRLPFAPPLGALMATDADEEAKLAWLRRSSHAGDPADEAELQRLLAHARENGYVLSTRTQRHEELDVMLETIANDVHTPGQARELMHLLDDLRDSYRSDAREAPGALVRMLAVPVHTPDGRVPFQIGIQDLDLEPAAPRVDEILAALRAAAAQIEQFPSTRRLSASEGSGSQNHDDTDDTARRPNEG